MLLRIFLFKPLNKMKQERTRTIQENLDSAEKARTEAEELKEQYENTIGEAKEEAKNIIMKAHDDAESERAAIIKKAHEEADQKVAEADPFEGLLAASQQAPQATTHADADVDRALEALREQIRADQD